MLNWMHFSHALCHGARGNMGSTKIKLGSGFGSTSARCGFCGGPAGCCTHAHPIFLLLLNQRSGTVFCEAEFESVETNTLLTHCQGGGLLPNYLSVSQRVSVLAMEMLRMLLIHLLLHGHVLDKGILCFSLLHSSNKRNSTYSEKKNWKGHKAVKCTFGPKND